MFIKRLLIIASCTSFALAHVVEINDQAKFTEAIKSGKSVVKFYSDGCPPCKASQPMLDALSNDNNYKDIHFIQVNFQRGRALAVKYARMFPTFAFFKDGKKVGSNIVGYDNNTRQQIIDHINSL